MTMRRPGVLWTIFLTLWTLTACAREEGPRKVRDSKFRSAVLIGWDGCRPDVLEDLLRAGKLPNLEKLASAGGYVRTQVSTGDTSTKPGWVEILTGCRAPRLGTRSNRKYAPIPKGYTVFERLKKATGGEMGTAFLAGKINNLGHRGPHKICINCISRDTVTGSKTAYWDQDTPGISSVPTYGGEPQRWVDRDGEPYFSTLAALDRHGSGLGSASRVGAEALSVLRDFKGRPFIAFFHFEEPDEQGHISGEGSREYQAAIVAADSWLGRITAELRKLGVREETAVFVVTDHGMDKGGKEHFKAPETFLATDVKRRLRPGDRKDVTPTVLDALGWNASAIRPRLDGRSLFVE